MSERLHPRYPERQHPKPLPSLVPIDTMIEALFNYYETSLTLPVKGENVSFHISDEHITKSGSNLNIVIAENREKRYGRERSVWYFDVFEGKPRSERTESEAKEYDKRLGEVIKRKNRVPGKELNYCIKEALGRLAV